MRLRAGFASSILKHLQRVYVLPRLLNSPAVDDRSHPEYRECLGSAFSPLLCDGKLQLPTARLILQSLVVIDKALRTHLQQPIFVRILAVMGFIASCFVLRIVVLWLLEYFVHYYASLPEPEEQLLSDKNEKKQEKPEHETETSDKKQAKSDKKKQQ